MFCFLNAHFVDNEKIKTTLGKSGEDRSWCQGFPLNKPKSRNGENNANDKNVNTTQLKYSDLVKNNAAELPRPRVTS